MKIITTLILLTLSVTLLAQNNTSSLGLRGGGVSGFTFKYLDEQKKGFEIIAGWKDGGFQVTGLLEYYKPIANDKIPGLYYFTGLGAHMGYAKYTVYNTVVVEGIPYYSYYDINQPIIGTDFILGIEYQFGSIPLNFSIDYKPYFEFFGQNFFRADLWDVGFSIRYSFKS